MTDPSWRDHATSEVFALWGQLLKMHVWVLMSDEGLVPVFDLGGTPTGMVAFDEQVLRDWAGPEDLQGHETARVNVPDCCHTMWSLGADSLAFAIDPRITEAFLEVGHDDLAWLGSGLVPSARAAGEPAVSDTTRSTVVSALDGIAGVDEARLIGAFVSEEDDVDCLELVVREDLPRQDQVSVFETVRGRLDTAERAGALQLALVVHQNHVTLSPGVSSWPVA